VDSNYYEIIPENNSIINSLNFIIKINTSYKSTKKIQILNNNGIIKDKNILEYNLIPSNYSEGHLLFTNILKEEKYIAKCIVPDETEELLKFNCSVNDINDNKNDYFKLEDSNDKIKIDNNTIIKLKGITKLTIKNIFKSNETEPEPDKGEEEKEQQYSSSCKSG
jgi:hypothetical protein